MIEPSRTPLRGQRSAAWFARFLHGSRRRTRLEEPEAGQSPAYAVRRLVTAVRTVRTFRPDPEKDGASLR